MKCLGQKFSKGHDGNGFSMLKDIWTHGLEDSSGGERKVIQVAWLEAKTTTSE